MNLEDYDFDRLLGLGYTEKATGDLKKACWAGYTAVGTKKKGGRTVPNCVPIKKSDHAEEMKRKPLIAGPSAGSPSFAEGESETLDFTTCQRSDGSTYGTSGKCRKGVEITKIETGIFQIKDADGNIAGSIVTSVGGGAVEVVNGRSSARYDAKVGDKKKENMTLAQAKAWAKEQLGEKIRGDAKVAIKGGLTAKGKAKRLENIEEEINEVRDEFNSQVQKWNRIPKEERKNHPNLKKNIEYLRNQYETLSANRKIIEDTPVVD